MIHLVWNIFGPLQGALFFRHYNSWFLISLKKGKFNAYCLLWPFGKELIFARVARSSVRGFVQVFDIQTHYKVRLLNLC